MEQVVVAVDGAAAAATTADSHHPPASCKFRNHEKVPPKIDKMLHVLNQIIKAKWHQ